MVVWYRLYIFIAPYCPKGGIGLVTINKFLFTTTTNYLKHYSIQCLKKCFIYSYICKLHKAFLLLWEIKGRKEGVDGWMDGWMRR